MLADNFVPAPGMHDERARQRDAVACFGALLAQQAGQRDDGATKLSLAERFQLVVDRYAAQLAAGMGARLVHGGLTPSNLALNGQWLDFGNSAATGDYGNVILRRQGQSFWGEIDFLAVRIRAFSRQYNRVAGGERLSTGDEAEQYFRHRFASHLRREIVSLAGFDVQKIGTSLGDRFADVVLKLLGPSMATSTKLYSPCPDYRFQTPSSTCRVNLGALFVYSALLSDPSQRASALAPYIASKVLLAQYCDAYGHLQDHAARAGGAGNTGHADEAVLVHALRKNITFKALYKETFLDESAEAARDDRSASQFIARTLGELLPLIGCNSIRDVDLGSALPVKLAWTAQRGFLFDDEPLAPGALRQRLLSHDAFKEAMNLKSERYSPVRAELCRGAHELLPPRKAPAKAISRLISKAVGMSPAMAGQCLDGLMEYVSAGQALYFHDEDGALIGMLIYTTNSGQAAARAVQICEGFILKGKLGMVLAELPSLFSPLDEVGYVKRSGAIVDVSQRVRSRRTMPRFCRCGKIAENCNLYNQP